MVNVILNGSAIPVHSLELNYENENLLVSIKTKDGSPKLPTDNDILDFRNLDLFLTSLLDAFQAPANLSGYCYLKQSLEMGLSNQNIFSSVTKDLYPVIASQHNATSAKVERSLHNVILAILNNKNQQFLKEFFGPSYEMVREKQHNSFILSCMVNRIKLILFRHPLDELQISE